jgi:hypothetical protein
MVDPNTTAASFEHMERIRDQLFMMDKRLDEMVRVTGQLVRNEERMNSQIERTDRIEKKLDSIERDFYGPEGVLVNMGKTMAKHTTQLAIILSLGSFALQAAFKFMVGQ